MVQNVTLLRCIEHEEVVFCKANFEKSSRTIHYFNIEYTKGKKVIWSNTLARGVSFTEAFEIALINLR